MSNLTNYYSAAKIQGATAAMKGEQRDSNPYAGADKPFDGYDEAMMPDDDERSGCGPL